MNLRSLFAAPAIIGALLLLIAVPLSGPARAQQAPAASPAGTVAVDPEALSVHQKDMLRDHARVEGSIIIPAEREAVLIQPAGRSWRFFHEVLLHWGGAALLAGAIAILAIAYLAIGRIRISAGRSGWRIQRFTSIERFSHWLTAISFVLLGLTGLNVTFGKLVLMPMIGRDAFGQFAEFCKYIHNFVSFAFVIGLVLIACMWIRDNIPRKVDLVWLKEGGGFIGGKHPKAGRFNAGEKAVFWFALGAGAAVAITGYMLLFPFYITNIFGMQIAEVIHAVVAVVFIAVILGHIYIGTLGMEGAFEAMRTGSVDLNWAKEHHPLWLEEERAKGNEPTPPPDALGSPAE